MKRILCHHALVDGKNVEMALLTFENDRLISAGEYDGIECHSTIFLNGTLHVQTDRRNHVVRILHNGRDITGNIID